MGTIEIKYKGNTKISGVITVNNYASEFSKVEMICSHVVVYEKTKGIVSRNRICAIYDLHHFNLMIETEFEIK